MPRIGGELKEDDSGTQRGRGTHDGRTPLWPTGTWVKAEGSKRGIEPVQERQQMQACGAGSRYERRRMSGGGGGGDIQFGRSFALGKDVGRGCKLRGLQIRIATDG